MFAGKIKGALRIKHYGLSFRKVVYCVWGLGVWVGGVGWNGAIATPDPPLCSPYHYTCIFEKRGQHCVQGQVRQMWRLG